MSNLLKYYYFKFLLISLTASFLFTSACHASKFMPIVANYTPTDYKGGLQNWALAQDSNGEIFIGNNDGLLSFDGYTWNKYLMPNNQLVRSILIDNGRIYVGTYEEFGYFVRNVYGALEYTSLWEKLENVSSNNDEIWNIFKVGENIYFQSFSSWFKYDGQTVTAHYDPDFLPLYFHTAHGKLYVQMINGDFYLLDNDQYKPLLTRSELKNDAVVAVIPVTQGKMILCTEWNGLFSYDGKTISPYPTAVDRELKTQQINRAILIPSDSTIVIGSIRSGIYAISTKGEEKWHYDVNNRLGNNSVLRLLCDRDNNVWAALDVGLALIHTGSPYSVLIPNRCTQPFGMVYGVSIFNKNMYIATNQSAWIYSFAEEQIHPIEGAEGQNWHVNTFDSQILLGNNFGTRTVQGAVSTSIPETETSGTCLRKCIIHGQEVLIESSYYTFRVYRKSGSKWYFSNSIEGFSAPIRQFEVDHSGIIWAAHMSLGLYKIELSKNLEKVEKHQYIHSLSSADSTPSLIHVMKIRGRVVLSDRYKTYTFDDLTQHIIPFTQLNTIFKNGLNSVIAVDDSRYWATDHRGYTLISYKNDVLKIERFIPSSFFGLYCNENNNNAYVNDNIVYFCLNNGIARIKMDEIQDTLQRESTLQIHQVTSLASDYLPEEKPISSNLETAVTIWGDITFELSYPNFSSEPLYFAYSLTGSGLHLNAESIKPVITYGSLGYGDYHFTACVKDDNGNVLSSVEYYFHKPPPFYLSIYAWIAYLMGIGCMVYGYSRWHSKKLLRKRNKEFEAEKVKQEFKMLEQEHIIAKQNEQLLEAELHLKERELASLALDAISQQKAVESLKESMSQQKGKDGINQQEIDFILKQLSNNLDGEEFWNIYQKNFDLIHQNFFRNLRRQYKNLTPSDLRFCALLRLNLSTKDIAQFSNLTIRGVETARYRLRKKFAIPEGGNLVDFLIDFV